MPERDSADVAIIGAGPIGIELAVALKKTGIDYLHFDARQIGYNRFLVCAADSILQF